MDASVVNPLRVRLLAQRWLPELDDGVAVPTVVQQTQRLTGILGSSPYPH
jgi:hypothetical protein